MVLYTMAKFQGGRELAGQHNGAWKGGKTRTILPEAADLLLLSRAAVATDPVFRSQTASAR
jgi:hypothetical protein